MSKGSGQFSQVLWEHFRGKPGARGCYEGWHDMWAQPDVAI